jgi:site-specific DNA recombinase
MKEDHHPAIIETKQWDNVQFILTKNRRYEPGSTYVRKNIHVFAGLLKCGYCGSYMVSSLDRERACGYRPSIYACSRKRRHGDCDNKYISDRTLGPFVLNYIANIMQAQRSFGKTTTIQTLGKKLLRGDALSDVKRIESRGLQELYDMFRRSINQSVSYVPPEIRDLDAVDSPEAQERSLLLSEKRKLERAMARLKSLYLYDDQDLSEREYFVERKRLSDGIDNIDKRLTELDNETIKTSLSDAAFIAQASFFILSQELTGKRTINYEKLIQKIDPKIIKDFVNSVAQNFCIKDGIVESIRFKNGLEQRFIYHDWV